MSLLDSSGKEIVSGTGKLSSGEFKLGSYELEITQTEDLNKCITEPKGSKGSDQASKAVPLKMIPFRPVKPPTNEPTNEPIHDMLHLPTQRIKTVENASVLPRIPDLHDQKPVIIDQILTRVLRSHQKEGVIFLYECGKIS